MPLGVDEVASTLLDISSNELAISKDDGALREDLKHDVIPHADG